MNNVILLFTLCHINLWQPPPYPWLMSIRNDLLQSLYENIDWYLKIVFSYIYIREIFNISENILGISWYDTAWVPHLNQGNILEYFSERSNPFYDRTCNNEHIKMQRLSVDQMLWVHSAIAWSSVEIEVTEKG